MHSTLLPLLLAVSPSLASMDDASIPLRDDALRTPDDRFADLADFPFSPNYTNIDGYRLHYLDEGPADGPVVLLLHGEPTWSYLYRKMIPVLSEAGLRSIAPDLIGFGRSDKPKSMEAHTYAFHVRAIGRLVEQLDLQGASFFGQDWGGLIGLRVVAEDPERFARVMISNTGLPTGDEPMTDAFMNWKRMNRAMIERGDMPVGAALARSTGDPAVAVAYDAPFPDSSHKAGPLILPQLVPTSPDDPAAEANRRAWQMFGSWEKPFLTAYGDQNPVTRGAERAFQDRVPGAERLDHPIIEGASHFIQESHGEELARLLVEFVRRN